MAANSSGTSLAAALTSMSLYKRNQGRMVRQLTFVAMVLAVCYGSWTLSNQVLSSFVNSSLSVAIVYNPNGPGMVGGDFEKSLSSKLGSYDKEVTDIDDSRRRVKFTTTTSRHWETDPKLRAAAAKLFDDVKVDLQVSELPSVKMSDPTHRVRQVTWIRLGVPVGLAVVLSWCMFRFINYPKFADFLISVEAEMDKVSWASKAELVRATVVVLTTMIFLGALLFVYDQVWVVVFRFVHFLEI